MSNEPPAPPVKPRSGRQPQSNSGTILALFGLLLIGGALLGLVTLVMPQAMAIILVIGGLFVVPLVLHYLTWGWWLSQMKDESAADRPAIKRPPPPGAD
jgi:hypothetical protein